MITRKLKNHVLMVYRDVLSDFQYREWHASGNASREAIRQMAIRKNDRLNDGRMAAFLYDRHGLPGDFGQTWSRGKPSPINAPFPVAKAAFRKLLAKVARAEAIDEGEFDAFRSVLADVGVPQAIANRFAAACFPAQLSEVVVDAEIDSVYAKLAADNSTPQTATTWFGKNRAVTDWIKEAIPGTDDAWRSLVAWRMH